MKLLIVADDYTGALDTGVKLAQMGVSTSVVSIDAVTPGLLSETTDVLVVNAESRHLQAAEAYNRVFRLVQAARERFPETALYKKTDSALRGNIGSELSAMLDASGQSVLAFVPALPAQGRTTVGGCQMDQGKPIHESVFSKDRYSPVRSSYIPEIIHTQTDCPVVCVSRDQLEGAEAPEPDQKRVLVFDSETDEDLRSVEQFLNRHVYQGVTAGCAGFASRLVPMLHLSTENHSPERPDTKRMCVVCGSVNPITRDQILTAEAHGLRICSLSAEVILNAQFSAEKVADAILQSTTGTDSFAVTTADLHESDEKWLFDARDGMNLEDVRQTISRRMGQIAVCLCQASGDMMPMLIGGDTLSGYLLAAGCEMIFPVAELQPGCVLSWFKKNGKRKWLVTKSGGLGDRALLSRMLERWGEA